MPLTEPGAMSVIGPVPVPKTTAQLDPGGVSCTTRIVVGDLGVVQIPEASLLVERLRPVDVGHWDRHEFQPHVRHGGVTCQ